MTFALMATTALVGKADGHDMVVTTADGQQHVFDSRQVEKVIFSDDLREYENFVSASYATSSSRGVYTLTIGDGEPDAYGDPASIGESQIVFSFIADVSENAMNAVLPAGKYVMGNGTETGTFDVQRSAVFLRIDEGVNGVDMMPIVSGEVEVMYVEGEYVITGNVSTFQGFTTEFIYTGPIVFQATLSESSPFDEDLNVTFEGAQMRYYGNWFDPFSDDLTLELYTGSFDDATQSQVEGYWFTIDLYMPKAADPWSKNIVLPDGVYNVEWRDRPENSTYLPYTYMPGSIQDIFGIQMPVGTYISHKYASGVTHLGVVTSGTITISGNGTMMEFDLVMDNGKKLTGKYPGKVACFNFHDNDAPEDIEMLDSDVDLEWVPNTVAVSYNDGPTILKDINTYLVMITDSQMLDGDYLSLYLLTEKDELTDGTYNIGKLENYGGIKGCVSYGGDILYSWYSDLSSTDSDGYQDVLAPIESGTVTVTTTDKNTKKIEIDLVTLKGKKISGVFEGPYMDYNDLPDASKKRTVNKKFQVKK